MLSRTIWCFVALSVFVESKNSITPFEISSSQYQIHSRVLEKQRLINVLFAVKSREIKTKEVKIIKRGIVLVDEDFDVPSAIYAHENNSGEDVGVRTDILETNEGSGNDVLDEKELIITTIQDTHQQSDYTISTKPTKEATSKLEKDIFTLTAAESSGDGLLISTKEYTITEVATKSHTELVNGLTIHDGIPDICMNSTCDQTDLLISLSEDKSLIAEGTNFTLSCKSNSSNHNMLYWYKSNGTTYFLQAFGMEEELLFNIPNAKVIHSGIYNCVKWVNKQTCCNLKSHLSVYETPLYKYHLIILGLIAAACLIICIFLSVRQTTTLKAYTKQFVEKHGRVKQQLL